jgi:uncharacterized membrane protein YqaE (UPF0057 family)
MTSLEYGKKCKKNKDCSSNICQMMYKNGEPKGRYCLEGQGKYTKECDFPRDCKSNECVKIFNNKGQFITKRCLKSKRVPKKESALKNLFGESPKLKYGVNNQEFLDNKIQQMGHAGPITEVIVMVFNILGDLFSIIVYNFRVCSWDYENQGILYSLLMTVATGVYKALLGPYDSGLFWGGIQSRYYDSSSKQCKANSKGFDMWYVRMLITILFPPMGVFMAKGLYGMKEILMSCFLTLLFYFPGLMYSLSIILSSKIDVEESLGLKNFKVK